jgi:hypothetical protein
MKKSMLTFLVGAAVVFFGYRYFTKKKAITGATTGGAAPVSDTQGKIIVPATEPATLYAGRPSGAKVYTGVVINLGHGYNLQPGDQIEVMPVSGGYQITRFLKFPTDISDALITGNYVIATSDVLA